MWLPDIAVALKNELNNEVWLSLGTFATAAGGGEREQKGVAVTCRLASCLSNEDRGISHNRESAWRSKN